MLKKENIIKKINELIRPLAENSDEFTKSRIASDQRKKFQNEYHLLKSLLDKINKTDDNKIIETSLYNTVESMDRGIARALLSLIYKAHTDQLSNNSRWVVKKGELIHR